MPAPQRHAVNEDVLLRQDDDAVVRLTLNRPAVRNSLSLALLESLNAAFDDITSSPRVRAVVIAASGPAFCAGHDLKELTAHRSDADGGRGHFTAVMHACAALMQKIVYGPKPVIAAVNGVATAAGCQLVASCDLAVASREAAFCTPGVNIGLFCSSPMVALTRTVGRKQAMEMLLLGEMIDAETARAGGLVNRIVDPDRVVAEAMAMARAIAGKPAATVAQGKQSFQRQLDLPLSQAYEAAAQAMVDAMLHRESLEGIGAFLDKRPPDWHQD